MSHKIELVKSHSPCCNLHLQFICSIGKRRGAAAGLRELLPGEPGGRVGGRGTALAAAGQMAAGQSPLLTPSFQTQDALGQIKEEAQVQAGSAGFPFLF